MKKIILDTDIGPDCEDAAAVATLNILADRGLCEILGMSHCTSNPYGAGTIDVINRYYGRSGVPISTYPVPGFLSRDNDMLFNRYIATHYENRFRERQPEPAVRMFRRLLSRSEDRSVTVIAIGPLVNLSDLLLSRADDLSALDGTALVMRKVDKVYLMAGIFRQKDPLFRQKAEKRYGKDFDSIAQWNVAMDIPAARNVACNWPTEKVYLGVEIGVAIVTGAAMRRDVPEDHPVRVAYELYTDDGSRFTWDSMLVLHAVLGSGSPFAESGPGTVRFTEEGLTRWTPCECGTDRYVMPARPLGEVAADFDALLVTPPRGGFPKDFH